MWAGAWGRWTQVRLLDCDAIGGDEGANYGGVASALAENICCMEDWLLTSWPTIAKTVASTILILIVSTLVARTYGLRSFAKISSIDFATTVAFGSVIASVIMGGETSVLKGAVAMFTLVGFQQLFSWLKRKSDALERVSENSPVYLMKGKYIIKENLDRSGITHADLMAKLREANVIRFSQVKAVVFETTGDISVLHGEDDTTVEPEILEGIAEPIGEADYGPSAGSTRQDVDQLPS